MEFTLLFHVVESVLFVSSFLVSTMILFPRSVKSYDDWKEKKEIKYLRGFFAGIVIGIFILILPLLYLIKRFFFRIFYENIVFSKIPEHVKKHYAQGLYNAFILQSTGESEKVLCNILGLI